MRVVRTSFCGLVLVSLAAGMLSVWGCEEQQRSDAESPAKEMKERQTETVSVEKATVESKGLPRVKLETTMGDIVVELNEEAAPVTVKNFLRYVEEGFYGGTIFHRVVPGFIIQAGGLRADMNEKPTHEPVINESNNGLGNVRGSIAMARRPEPNSATSQFFINLADNDFLNYAGPDRPRYAVFGKVIEGMEVVDAIAGAETERVGDYPNVPVEAVIIKSAGVITAK